MYLTTLFLSVLICNFLNYVARVRSQGHHMFGVTLTFIATRSGLLRWREHGSTNNRGPEP